MANTKYLILIGDGMADYQVDRLDGRTPLEYASTPNMDAIAGSGRYGLFATVPPGFSPGSDVANLSILGYDPAKYYTGRAPLEAASIGVKLGPGDVAFRCNLVTLAEKDDQTVMDDYSAGHITTDEASRIIDDLDRELAPEGVRFFTGTSYRHLMVWREAPDVKGLEATPPHDLSDKPVEGGMPRGAGSDKILKLMERSREVLKNHPVNAERVKAGKKPATSVWLWGQGTAPKMPTLADRFGVDGAIISAVDLMKGIGIYAGLEVLKVPGITGYIDTNYRGKAEAALDVLKRKDFVCVHVEAPDEAGHNGNLDDKLRAIEDFDEKVVGRILKGMEWSSDYRVMALTDHPTPVSTKTHASDPVPFAFATAEGLKKGKGSTKFSEPGAGLTGLLIEDSRFFVEEFFGRPEQVCAL